MEIQKFCSKYGHIHTPAYRKAVSDTTSYLFQNLSWNKFAKHKKELHTRSQRRQLQTFRSNYSLISDNTHIIVRNGTRSIQR